ncbi:hypothetical protein KIN20_031582 [Parelaphostrongylus tenuis]|uniref:Calpain catalytic domain-containing protein n=1 Tax=Parelaphostrongylus tenuis TaxID=148309 RepID=A0AAD5R5R3_PARTN|nr:hypothetical protein KIN20_031582 [Parelaphostrongylus tenuis]
MSSEEEYDVEEPEEYEESEEVPGGDQYGYDYYEEEPEEAGYVDRGEYDDAYGEAQDYQDNPEIESPYEEECEPETESHDEQVEEDVELQSGEDEDLVAEESTISYAADTVADSGGADSSGGLGSVVQGVLDGFGGSNLGDIVGSISQIAGGGGGLTNLMSSGGMETIVEKMLGEAAHRFLGINPATGAIIGAIAGNLIFNMGGRGNSLTSIGKVILDNIISGEYKRDVRPFVPPVPTPGATTFGLDFYAERDRCLTNKILFEDPEFPASDRSLYYKAPPTQHVEWKRPGEIVDNPQLIVGEQSRFDVKQGALGDCWLLAAVANLTLRDELFYRVVPPDQSFTENYAGGTTAEALEDFTGGLTEFYDLRKTDKSTILAMMIRGFQMGSLFGCSIEADPNQKEAPLDNGLVRGHAYSITALHTIASRNGEIPIVRIRNPWGNSKEWNGAWSDGSPEWDDVDEQKRSEIGVEFAKDGEFWMSFDDFHSNFMQMEICNLSAAVMNEVSEMTGVNVTEYQHHLWEERAEDGEWSTQRGTAGGCANNPDTYAQNPQYGSYFVVTEDSVEHDGKCTVIVAVLQKYRREMRTIGKDSLPIGFAVYEVGSPSYGALDADFLLGRKPTARTRVFINMREVTCRFRVPAGHYVILPCTFEPNSDGEFLLRIYVNGKLQTSRLK